MSLNNTSNLRKMNQDEMKNNLYPEYKPLEKAIESLNPQDLVEAIPLVFSNCEYRNYMCDKTCGMFEAYLLFKTQQKNQDPQKDSMISVDLDLIEFVCESSQEPISKDFLVFPRKLIKYVENNEDFDQWLYGLYDEYFKK